MTMAEVKDQLPDVKLHFNGKLYQARVRGRKEPFALVYIPEFPAANFYFAWKTVTDAINGDGELTA